MKEVRITLSDDTVAAIEAEIAGGEAGSVSELIEFALDAYLRGRALPSPDEMYEAALVAEAEADATGGWLTADQLRHRLDELQTQ